MVPPSVLSGKQVRFLSPGYFVILGTLWHHGRSRCRLQAALCLWWWPQLVAILKICQKKIATTTMWCYHSEIPMTETKALAKVPPGTRLRHLLSIQTLMLMISLRCHLCEIHTSLSTTASLVPVHQSRGSAPASQSLAGSPALSHSDYGSWRLLICSCSSIHPCITRVHLIFELHSSLRVFLGKMPTRCI